MRNGGEENVQVRLCVSTGTDFEHRYLEYFFPTSVHYATNWMNFSYWWRKTETFLPSSVLCFTETWLCGLIPDSVTT